MISPSSTVGLLYRRCYTQKSYVWGSNAFFFKYFSIRRRHANSVREQPAREFPRLIFRKLGVTPWQIRAVIRRGFMADTSRNNKEYPVSLPFLSNKSRAAHSRIYLSSTRFSTMTSPLTLKSISSRSSYSR